MGSLGFAVIGCGRIASRHAEHIAARGRLVAVCDTDAARRDELAGRHGARAYDGHAALLAAEPEVDVVSICTPNGLHREHAVAALEAGHHVVCEKPMALTVADCREMARAAQAAGKQLFIVKQNRFNPPVVALKEAVDRGALGRIVGFHLGCLWNRGPHYYEGSWKGTRTLDGGTLYTQFSHFIDLLHWLLGDVAEVAPFAANLVHGDSIEFEDTCVVAMRLADGGLGTAHFTINSYGKNMEGSLTVFGERGTVKIGGQYLNELEYAQVEDYEFGPLDSGRGANDYGTYQGSMSNHDKVYDNVLEVLREGGTISATADDGMRTVDTIERIYAACGDL